MLFFVYPYVRLNTLNIYSHMFQSAQAKVSEAMDSAFDFLKKDDTD